MADDAFQQAFLQVHLKCDQFKEGRKFRPWLYTIATTRAIDLQRSEKKHNRAVSLERQGLNNKEEIGVLKNVIEGEHVDRAAELDHRERCGVVADCVGKLSEATKRVVDLVYYRGLKYREAAEVLEIPIGTVKSRLHAAVNKLSQELEKVGM